MEYCVSGVGNQPHNIDGNDDRRQRSVSIPVLAGNSADRGSLALLKKRCLSLFEAFGAKLADQVVEFARPESVLPLLARVRMALSLPPEGARRAHRLPGKLVVSLTSHPRQFRTLSLTLNALLEQTVKADRTILWVTPGDKHLLPKDVLDFQDAGLEIGTAEDLRSYMKILPALDAFPDAFICTADDDTYYWPTWLQELVDGYNCSDPAVTCHRAHGITVDAHGRLKPYGQWLRHVRPRGRAMHLFPTGCMGVLYPPGTLVHNAEDRAAALERCPMADDIWLYWMGQRNGAHYKTVGRRRRQVTWPGSQQTALWSFNVNGGNDLQIQQIAEKYGYPPILTRIAEASVWNSSTPISAAAIQFPTYTWAIP